jgi:hypothetical protein
VGSLVDHPDQQEQGAGDHPVGDHLQQRPMQALLGEDEDAQGDEAHVADRAVGDQLLEVRLDQGDDRAVNDRDQRQGDDQWRPGDRGVGEERHRETDQPVAAQLEEHAGKDDRARGGCLDVCVG